MNEQKDASTASATSAADPCARWLADFCGFLRTMAPPEEAFRHFRSARVEVLKGLRAVIDSRIERLSQEPSKGTTVPID